MIIRILLMVSMMQIMLWGGAGDLDSTFGSDGIVTTAVGSDSVAIQSDGKIVVAGSSDFVFAVVRYDTEGNLDSTFSGDGIVRTAVGSGDFAKSVAIQSDGKIVVAGSSDNGSNYDFAVVRYDIEGNLDSTFNDDGIVTTDIVTGDYAESVAIQSDGKIVVAGYSGNNYDFTVVRYDTNGSLDSTFGSDGIVRTAIVSGNEDYAHSVAIQSDGKIVVAGWSWSDHFGRGYIAVVRYDTDGNLDSTFDGDGIVRTAVESGITAEGYSVAIQSDGKIVVAGSSGFDIAVVRYDTDGSLDSTFGGDGKVTTSFGSDSSNAKSVAIQSNGKIVVAGYSGNFNKDFTVVRYNTDGSLDSTFDGDGKVTTSIGSDSSNAKSVAIQSDGKIVVAGSGNVVVRYIGDPVITLIPIYYLLQ